MRTPYPGRLLSLVLLCAPLLLAGATPAGGSAPATEGEAESAGSPANGSPGAPLPGSRQLTSAAEVLALSVAEAAAHLPVRLHGIVTAAEPDWQGKFVVQDGSAGVFVQNVGRQPVVGDVVEFEAVTGAGWFAPVVQSTSWRKVGTASLPAPKRVTIERLMAGVEASQRVEVTGLVRAVSYVPSQKTQVDVAIGGYRVRVYPKLPGNVNPRSLIGATVRIRGTASTSFNAARRQLTAVSILVPTADDFTVVEPEHRSPYDKPIVPLGDIARYRADATLGERMRVRGSLTFQRVASDFYLQDGTGGLRVETQNTLVVPLGRTVEAIGFLEFVNFQPVLKDAVFAEVDAPLPPVTGRGVPFSDLREGMHGAELIVLRGTLMDRSVRPVTREGAHFVGRRVVYTLRHAEQSFLAEYEMDERAAIRDVAIGSEVEAAGVAVFESADTGKPKSISLLLPTPGHLRVIRGPSWFTATRLLVGFGIVSLLLAATTIWLLTVAKKNTMLGFLIKEREEAQRQLQEAHDQLEVRVKERTEQLKTEMSVRKAAEVEFRAVLTERTRLARELHDTLEQALTGIALQLDTAARLLERNDPGVARPLALARDFLHQSQVELRRSIWDLRSRELEQFDLSEALAISSRQIAAGSGVTIEVSTEGGRRRLPEIVEENLLRIAQESLTNVVKHSGANRAIIRLDNGPDAVALEVRDNGVGLDAERLSALNGNHFGLLGISERAKRLHGRLEVSGVAGQGTTVRVVIPLDQNVPPAAPVV